jgi:hypothetical protein
VLWYRDLTNAQSANIERVQKRAFRIIEWSIPGVEYFAALNHLKMQMLSERRENHCIDLIANLSSPEHRLHGLLPDRVR